MRRKMLENQSADNGPSNKTLPLLSDLQEALRLELSGVENPATAAVARGWRDCHRMNPTLARTWIGILTAQADLILEEEDLPTAQEALASLPDLERHPLNKFTFASTIWKGIPIGLLIEKDRLQGGGLLYVISLFNPSSVKGFCGRVELRASRANPEPFASMLAHDGWQRFSIRDATSQPLLSFALCCLAACHRFGFRRFNLSELEDASAHVYPAPDGDNERFGELCALAYQDKVVCTRVVVDIDRIVPDNMSHALQYPLDMLKAMMSFHVDGKEATTELLLYEHEGHLVMCDDYPAYLTYKALFFKRIPAVILGDFDPRGIEIAETGRSELIPPIVVTQRFINPTKRRVDEFAALNDRLLPLAPREPTVSNEFTRIYLEFCRLLQKRRKREAELHTFLRRNPAMLDGHAATVHSEVRVGGFRADLVLLYDQLDKRVVLIELEMDSAAIFNKKGRLRADVVHASQQIEDWIGAIRGNDPRMPEWLKGVYFVEGLVVIGRSTELDNLRKKTLFNINSPPVPI